MSLSSTASTTTTTAQLPTQTFCSLMLGRPNSNSTTATTSDPSYTQSIPIILWIGQCFAAASTSASLPSASASTSSQQHRRRRHHQKWLYFSYQETDKQNFPHTAALLDQYSLSMMQQHPQPLQQQQQQQQRLLVTREVAPKNEAQEAVFDALASWCVQNYNNNNDVDVDNDDDIVEVHSTPISVSKEAVATLLDQTLPNALSKENYLTLQAATDFTWSIRKAFVWTMQTTGLDTATTTINNDNDTTPPPLLSITSGIVESHLRIDRTAAAAIHLWPVQSWGAAVYTSQNKPHASLWGLLSQPLYTTAGKRLLEVWLRQPVAGAAAGVGTGSSGLSQLQARQDAVALLVQRSVGRDAIRQEGLRLFQSTDLSSLIVFLANQQQSQQQEQQPPSDTNHPSKKKKSTTGGGVISTRKALQSLYQLYEVSSQKLPLLLEQVENALAHDLERPLQQQPPPPTATAATTDSNAPSTTTTTASTLLRDHVLLPLRQGYAELQRSVQLCEAVLDLEAAPREFLVQPVYDEHLQELQTELQQIQDELTACHQDMNAQWEQVTGQSNAVRLDTISSSDHQQQQQEEWQFRLPNTNDSKTLQQQFGSQVTIHRLLKNGVYFSTKPLRQLACKKQELRTEYDQYQKQIAADALQVACSYVPCLEMVRDSIALLDVLTALAHVAAYSPAGSYCRPILTDSDEDGVGIELKQARHPCVELQENLTEFIPNDVSLKFGESSFLLVTGPNMGGKSTYIRALGAIVTMAQIGSFVPCESAKINLCHHILARVGAGDLQERGISTFMAEMLESSSILRTATKRSLIIIDELGRGTSTFDGYGLARAISEYICQKIGCMTVFATHFHELTALEEQQACVKNCHVTARKGSQGLTFLYQVKPGPCLESFGIQVAEMAQVPAVVIQDAKRKAEELENFEYRPKRRAREGDGNHDDSREQATITSQDAHASAEESAAALACMNRFLRLPESVFTRDYGSNEEKRAAFVQLLEAS